MRDFIRSLVNGISSDSRSQRLAPILDSLQLGATVLDVGVWTAFPEPHPSENWLEKQPCGSGVLVAVGLECMTNFKRAYPDARCVQADGSALPFRDGSVDVAMANAVLEHVEPDRQQVFVKELVRVSSEYAWLAVPDRWCPLEIHTRLPILHWLPCWRALFKHLGHAYWSTPTTLNLFSMRTFKSMLTRSVNGHGWTFKRQTRVGIPMTLVARYTKKP